MLNYRKLNARFRQFGGIRLLWAYLREGLLAIVLRMSISVVMRRKSRDEAYAVIRQKVNRKLQKQYAPFIKERKDFYDHQEVKHLHSKKVWVCWLQGFDQAPPLVKACVASMRKYLKDQEIILLSYDNYREYVELPQDVVEKYEQGMIPSALLSDLLRLELLIKHGGTWMDATILCTGEDYPKELLDCDLFLYQGIVKGDCRFHGISNWFITARTRNKLLMTLRDVLLQYWKEHNVTLNYYMFHDFFYAIAQLYPEEIAAMPRENRLLPLQLMWRMSDTYDALLWERLKALTCFHKLNYRISPEVESNTANFYHAIIKEYVEETY